MLQFSNQPQKRRNPKTMWVFISSPADVQKERDGAKRVLARLNEHEAIKQRGYEFRPLDYREVVPPFGAVAPQKSVDIGMKRPRDADVYICIFGGRFGSPLEDELHNPIKDPLTGKPYLSGTEYEFLDAYRMRQTGPTPTMLLYRNISYEPDQQLREFLDRFYGSHREFNGFFNEVTSPEMFEERLYSHLFNIYGSMKRKGLEDKPDTGGFVGRAQELRDLPQWITEEKCRIVSLVAPGGVGKSTLAAELLSHVEVNFEFIFWQTLQNKEPLEGVSPREGVLEPCLRFLSDADDPIPDNTDARLDKLIEYLRNRRCLIVLDNMETIMQSAPDDQFQAGYEEYGRLIERLGATDHQSCLLITTRQQPASIKTLAIQETVVRSYELPGLPDGEAVELLKKRLGAFDWIKLADLVTSDVNPLKEKFEPDDWARVLKSTRQADAGEDWAETVESVKIAWTAVNLYFGGNPLALLAVAGDIDKTVRQSERIDMSVFIERGSPASMRMGILLERQIRRLSQSQQAVLYWLAIRRQPVLPADLAEALLPSPSEYEVRVDLTRLQERNLVERRGEGKYTLQPVIIEHMTARLVDTVCAELDSDHRQLNVFSCYPLITAYQTEDAVREHQQRLILKEVERRLLKAVQGNYDSLVAHLKELLGWLHQHQSGIASYATGNILNLLVQAQNDMDRDDVLSGCDCSGLYVWEAMLQGVNLRNADFRMANLKRSVFTEPFGTILSVAISPDGQWLVGGTGNGDIRFWEAATGRSGEILKGTDAHTAEVWTVAFNRDGTRLASGSEDRTVNIYEVFPSGRSRLISTLLHEHPIRSVAFSPVGQLLATGEEGRSGIVSSDDNAIHLYRCERSSEAGETWRQVGTPLRGHDNWIRSVAFSPNGRLLASGGEDKAVRIWDVTIPEKGRLLQQLRPHEGVIRSVAFSPDGQMLASASEDRTIRLWNSASWGNATQSGISDKITWNEYRTLSRRTIERRFRSLAFSPDGRSLASGGDDAIVRVWDVTTGAPTSDGLLMVGKGHKSWIWSVAYTFVPDREGHLRAVIVSGSEDQTVRMWDATSGNTLYVMEGQSSWIRSVAFHPDGKILASGEDRLVRYWDATPANARTTPICTMPIRGEEQEGHTGWVRAVAFHPSGNVLASCGEDHTIKLWARDGHHLRTLRGEGETNPIRAVAFSPNGNILAGAEDELIRLWRLMGDPERDEIVYDAVLGGSKGHHGPVWTLAFSPDGKLLASGGEDRAIRIWDVASQKCLRVLTGHTSWVRALAFIPPKIWEHSSHRGLLAPLFRRRTAMLASGGEDDTVRLWSVYGRRSRVLSAPPNGTIGNVRSVIFHPDGNLLLSATDRLIRLWDVRTGKLVGELGGHNDWIWSLSFSPDNHWLASGSSDLTIRLWQVPSSTPRNSQWRCVKIMQSERPYERMNIRDVQGIFSAQIASLELLGAVTK